jgi:hypothetical protein
MQEKFFFFQDTDEETLAQLCYLLAGPAEIQSLISVNPQVTSSHTLSSLRPLSDKTRWLATSVWDTAS